MKISILSDQFVPDLSNNSLLAYCCALELSELGNEIQVLTSFRESFDYTPILEKVQFLQAFKKWNFMELAEIINLLFQFRPHIIHYLPGENKKVMGLVNGFQVISGIKALLPQVKSITSLNSGTALNSFAIKNLALTSDFVTLPEVERKKINPLIKSLGLAEKTYSLDPNWNFIDGFYPSESSEPVTSSPLIWCPNQLDVYCKQPKLLDGFRDILSKNPSWQILLTSHEKSKRNSELRKLQSFLNSAAYGCQIKTYTSSQAIPKAELLRRICFVSTKHLSKSSGFTSLIMSLAEKLNNSLGDENLKMINEPIYRAVSYQELNAVSRFYSHVL